MEDITNRLRQALATSRHPDRILAVASAIIAWFVVTVLRAVVG
jgi:hypothetical protein